MADSNGSATAVRPATSPVKKPWKSKDGLYYGGLRPVRFAGGDPYANDPSTTK